jgi:hypothetical protein
VSLACAVIALLAIGASACSSAGTTPRPIPTLDLSKRDLDGDIDMLTKSSYDGDHDAIPDLGQPAGAADRRAIIALIGRYYASAAAGEGAKACPMLYALSAERFVEEQRHPGNKSPSLRGTCAQILSQLFKQRHHELVGDAAAHRVLAVRVQGNRGLALVRFGAPRELRELEVLVHREHGAWKMETPLENGTV